MGLIVVADGKFVGKSTGGDVVARADQNWPCGTVFKMILSKDAPKVECADGYYQDKIPDGYTCDEVIFDDQKCYTDCKKNEQKYTVTVNFTARANSLEHPGDCHYVQSHTPYVEITLNGQTKSAVASTGSVTFTNVPPGTYTISMSAQIGVTGVSTAGSDGKCRTSEEAVSTENILTQSKTIKVNNNTSTSMAVHCCMADPSIIL